ncbi:MAG: SPFH domain-containing protein [Phycisphaerales bacterium]
MRRIIVIALIVIAFLGFMVTYTVRFTEKAVVTTFGRADENSVKGAGLRFKIPYVQSVTKYDTRARYIETAQETHQTADNSQILVTAFMVWHVNDPLQFFKSFSGGDSERDHYKTAETALLTKLRSAMSEVSRFGFGELLSPDEKKSRLAELESNMLKAIEQSSGPEGTLNELGVRVAYVGINRLGLPANTTRTVFARMNAERKNLADKAISEGEAEANSLISSAESDKKKIESFADRLALDIRRQGEIEASEWLKQMRTNPRLAVFLRNMELFRAFNGSRTTLVFPTSMPGLEVSRPDALRSLRPGEIPAPDLSRLMDLPADKPAGSTREPGKPVSAVPSRGEDRP